MSASAKLGVPGGSDSGKAGIYNSGTDHWDLVPVVQGVNGGKETLATVSASGAAYQFNVANFNVWDLTLTANCTLSFTGFTSGFGCSIWVILRQDGTGGRTVTWPASTTLKWPSGSAPFLTTTANGISLLTFVSVDGGTTIFGGLSGNDYA